MQLEIINGGVSSIFTGTCAKVTFFPKQCVHTEGFFLASGPWLHHHHHPQHYPTLSSHSPHTVWDLLNLELLSSFSNLVSAIWFKNRGTSNIVNICEPNQSFNSSCLVEKIEAQIRVWASPLDKPQNCGTAPVMFSWLFTGNDVFYGPKGWGLKRCKRGVWSIQPCREMKHTPKREHDVALEGWMDACVCMHIWNYSYSHKFDLRCVQKWDATIEFIHNHL